MTLEARTIGEMAETFEDAARHLRDMERDGVTLDPDSGVGDDYAQLVTDDEEVARKYEFEEEDFDEDEEDTYDGEDATPEEVDAADLGTEYTHVRVGVRVRTTRDILNPDGGGVLFAKGALGEVVKQLNEEGFVVRFPGPPFLCDCRADGLEVAECHDCGARPGMLHRLGCDLEPCPYCGGQLLSCEHFFFGADDPPPDDDRLPWTGEWPAEAEAREFGWYSRRVPGVAGWVPCGKDDPGAGPDLNRVYVEATWDRQAKRFVRA